MNVTRIVEKVMLRSFTVQKETEDDIDSAPAPVEDDVSRGAVYIILLPSLRPNIGSQSLRIGRQVQMWPEKRRQYT